ncbi:MAG: hypothetical protein ABMA13_10310 [Chthoniobacteraceae bacterium]
MLRYLALLLLTPALFAEAPKTTQLNFLRTRELPGSQSVLETLSAEYKPAGGAGPSVWLIGVSHLGTPEYYAAIQKRLDAQTAVLFEGIDAGRLQQGAKADTAGGLQGQLAKALGLVFQLDAIDYQRPHFANSDLTADGLNEAIERRAAAPKPQDPARPGDPAKPAAPAKVNNETFDQLMSAMHGKGELAESLGGMITLMGSTPEMRETTKLMLVEALAQAGELIDLAKAASPDMRELFEVLITERNAEVIRQLEPRLRKLQPGQSIAIFYGAAHMDEIARRLTSVLSYTPAAQHWDAAFGADGTKSIMPAAQIKALLQGMRAQMKPGADGQPELPLFDLLKPRAK